MESIGNVFGYILVVVVVLPALCDARQSFDRRFCRDELKYSDCQFYKNMGLCEAEEYKPVLSKKCPMSCNLCSYGLEKLSDCIDKDGHFNCEYLKQHDACKTHANIMADRCAKTCNLCDAEEKCAKKKCFHNQVCMLDEQRNAQCTCPTYCPNSKGYKKLGTVCGSDMKSYQDLCHLQHDSCKEEHNITVVNYGICKIDELCDDAKAESERGLCREWEKAKLCGDEFYGDIMRKYCKKTCGHCPDPSRPPYIPLRGECDDKSKSPYGCCWDLTNAPAPPARCPVCKDRYPQFCQSFMQQCNSSSKKNTNFMKSNCPVTCGFCIPDEKPKVVIKIYNRSGQRLFTTKLSTQND